MDIEFRKITDFPRGTLYDILKDAYAFDPQCAQCWDEDWRQSDAFFFDHPDIADRYGFVTCLHGEPIGFITWARATARNTWKSATTASGRPARAGASARPS